MNLTSLPQMRQSTIHGKLENDKIFRLHLEFGTESLSEQQLRQFKL